MCGEVSGGSIHREILQTVHPAKIAGVFSFKEGNVSGHGDKADRIIYDLNQRNTDLESEVERLRRVEGQLLIRIEGIERETDGSNS